MEILFPYYIPSNSVATLTIIYFEGSHLKTRKKKDYTSKRPDEQKTKVKTFKVLALAL